MLEAEFEKITLNISSYLKSICRIDTSHSLIAKITDIGIPFIHG
ncbi:hypothetical protein BN168_510090 [Clostridioides difficile CD002]|nr:hypothetical protein QIG_2404 [Clostridioides difficile DA00065]EQK21720.1 hypothetical protein QUY_2428 [Clostridioides difficile P71]EQK30772.1 hypothetical protein QW3_2438 [Clostridioides difficile P74]CCL02714.1 hypothetical protein BN167_1440007 [Clostridioides difficile E13]CCL07422.1 hypothetical protein BN168_510090 [Clostridioides difficile CD002]